MHALCLFLMIPTALAQWQSKLWLHVDGAYVQREVKQDGGSTLTSTRAGVRGELGLSLGQHFAVSGAALYHDGEGARTNGATETHATGYVSDTRALLHLIYAPFVLTGGIAQFESFDALSGLYRQRTSVAHKPISLTVNWGAMYVTYEQTLNSSGSITRTDSDQGGGRVDIKFELPKARERALEVGVFLPSPRWSTHIFANYTRWTLDEAPNQSNGVESTGFPRTVASTLFAGIGLAF